MYGGCLVQQLFSFARNSSEMLRTYCTIQLAEVLASLLQLLCSLLICFEVTLLQLWDLCRLCCFLVDIFPGTFGSDPFGWRRILELPNSFRNSARERISIQRSS